YTWLRECTVAGGSMYAGLFFVLIISFVMIYINRSDVHALGFTIFTLFFVVVMHLLGYIFITILDYKLNIPVFSVVNEFIGVLIFLIISCIMSSCCGLVNTLICN